jgi:two-component system, chemotaxis family, chemotaxis protein CheY
MARVMITDDAAFMRMMIRNILTQNGHDVVGEAENGQQAIERYKEVQPDICTMDITMPEKDGIAALREILASDPTARVVMCSALGQEAKVIESIRAGAKEFIVKPFEQSRVLAAIEKALA